MLRYIQILMFGVLTAIGVFLLASSLQGLYYSHQAVHWIAMDAVVDNVSFSSGSGGARKAKTSSRKIIYSYAVGGQEYIGDREYFGVAIATNKQTSGGYTAGSVVKAYYDPGSPKDSVLKPNSRRNVWTGIVFSFPFLVFGLFGLRKYLKEK